MPCEIRLDTFYQNLFPDLLQRLQLWISLPRPFSSSKDDATAAHISPASPCWARHQFTLILLAALYSFGARRFSSQILVANVEPRGKKIPEIGGVWRYHCTTCAFTPWMGSSLWLARGPFSLHFVLLIFICGTQLTCFIFDSMLACIS